MHSVAFSDLYKLKSLNAIVFESDVKNPFINSPPFEW